MAGFFGDLLGYIEIAFEFLLSLIESLLMAVTFITSSSVFNVAIVGLVPPIIGTCVTIVIAIGIAKFILGR